MSIIIFQGLLWAMALTRLLVTTEELRWLVVQPSELAILGTASLCLTLVNIVCIFLAGVAVYKVKEVSPLERKDISWWKANRSRMQAKQNKDNLNWDVYKLSDVYIPMEVETKASLETQTASGSIRDKTQNLDEMQHSYYNIGYQNGEICEDGAPKVPDYPTLKPSLSYTVEAKNQVLLDKKSYDV
ncbi:hypothetical protein HF086_005117 [Spodoptera exigua]|uniref:Uncharacterized protein n=1 Tax=Spodoptera exigua TaxID=7107 RepID=A0A922SLA2_SPOEX|nr:hypothetical protein HF086_005117 [Spodoptera exigua]